MTKFSPELLQKIKDAVNIVEIVGEHVVLRKSGANYTGLCPFHQERSPSFSVSENKQLYHCYGCKKGGDLFSFRHGDSRDQFSRGDRRACRTIASGAPQGLGIEKSGSNDPEVQKKRAAAREKMAIALSSSIGSWPHFIITNFRYFRMRISYFRSRGIPGADSELGRSFYVGASAPVLGRTRRTLGRKAKRPFLWLWSLD